MKIILSSAKAATMAALLLLSGIADGANPSATLSVQVVPAVTAGGTVPAPAAAAGFTNLIIDYDFTQTNPWSNRNSWLRCNDGSGAGSPLFYATWVGFGGANWPPCGNIAQRTDPFGSLALNLHMDKATINAMGCEPNCNMLYEALETVDNFGNGNLLPQNHYIEVTLVTRASDPSMQNLVSDEWSFAVNSSIEWDGLEWFGSNTGYSTYHNPSSGNVQTNNNMVNRDESAYHKIAWRVTSNGSNDGYFCSYLDDAPSLSSPGNCESWAPTTQQASQALPSTVSFLLGFYGCGGVSGSGSCPNSSIDLYIARLRVWSCAGINSGATCFTSSANP